MEEQDLTIKLPENYDTAVDYLTGFTGKLNAVTNQVNSLTAPAYQPSLLTAVKGIQDHLSEFSSIQSILPKVEHLAVTSPIMDLSRQATSALAGLSSSLSLTEVTSSISANIQPWYEANIAKVSMLPSSALTAINIPDTCKTLESLIGADSLSTLALSSSVVKATELSVFAEKSLFAVNIDNIGNKLGIVNETKEYLTSSFVGLSTGYSDLLKSFENNPLTYAKLNPSLTKLAPIEYFTSANLLEAISIDEEVTVEEEVLKNDIQYENEVSLSEYLPKIEPGLYKMWKGAIEAYNSDNSDKVRHFSASIRELFTHLMHRLAPDDEIKEWTSEKLFFHNGRPTRKARMLYICRNISNDPFNKFVIKDVDATIAFIDIFQKGTHDIDPNLSPSHLMTIKSKAESTLKFILEIHFKSN